MRLIANGNRADRMRADLDVYVENRQQFLRRPSYILHHVVKQLKQKGVSVRLLDRLDPSPEARVAFVHVDLTTVPAPYTWVNRLYARCLNGRSFSIARDLYSMARLFPGDDCPGPVIVKSLLNHRGHPELEHVMAERRLLISSRFRPWRRKGERRAFRKLFCPDYRILAKIDDVPDAVWSDAGLIVERFVPGSLDLPIVKYRQEFMLDLELNTRAEFNDLMCTSNSMIRLDFVDGAPPEVYDVRRRLELDFGSIDYFVEDGRAIVIDVNKTTTFTPEWLDAHEELRTYLDTLATRLASFVTLDSRLEPQ